MKKLSASLFITLLTLLLAAVATAALPKSVTLSQADLGATYKLTASKPISNALAASQAHVSVSSVIKTGRLSGYEKDYELKSITSDSQGAAEILSKASLFKATSGAHSYYLANLRKGDQGIGSFHPKRITAMKIGDESATYSGAYVKNGITFTVFICTWRSGKNLCDIIALGLKGHFQQPDIEILATKMQQHVLGH